MALPTASDNVFTRFLISEGGSTTTPASGRVTIYAKADGLLYSKDDAGTETLVSGGAAGAVATDAIWDAAGDLAIGTGANTAAKLTVGASGKVPASNGTTLAYVYPPGYQFGAGTKTSSTSITATTEGTADTIVTASSFAFDGSTTAYVEFYAFSARPDSSASNRSLSLYLYDDNGGGAASIGRLALFNGPAAVADNKPVLVRYFLTPSSATHTYSVRGAVSAGTGNVGGGAGGNAADMPAYIRVFKAG